MSPPAPGTAGPAGGDPDPGRAPDPLPLRVAVALTRAALLLLPADFRADWGGPLMETSRRRLTRALETGGPVALAATLARELVGLAATAARARRPDAWTRRTAPLAWTPRRTHATGIRGSAPTGTVRDGPRAPSPGPLAPDSLMDAFASDVRFALRTFVRRPAMMALAAGSLALGIGASSAMFSVVDSVLLRPLPFADPEELVSVYPTWPDLRGHPTLGDLAERGTFSWPEYWALDERQAVFRGIAAYDRTSRTLSAEDGPPVRLSVGRATLDLFDVLGVRPLGGRLFGPADDPRDGVRSVLLTEGFWTDHFGRAPGAVGATLLLNDEPFTVVGVLPAEVEATTPDVHLWVPVTGSSTDEGWGNHGGTAAVARLAAGTSLTRAADEVARILREAAPPDHGEHGGAVHPRLEDQTRTVRPALLLLVAASVLLLVVGCGNVALLLLGAGLDRQQELQVRAALGAARGRIGRQLLTEGLVLAAVGGALGVLLAAVVTRALLLLAPPGVPRIAAAGLDVRVLAFAVVAAGLSGVLFGLAPALGLSDAAPAGAVSSSRGTTARRARTQGAVVVGELALATVLLVSAALLGRTLLALNRVDPGFEVRGLVELRLAPPYQRLTAEDPAARTAAVDAYFQRFVDELAAFPGVESVAVTSNVPLTGDRGNNEVLPEGWDPASGGVVAERRFVSPSYFGTLRLPLLEGRGFTAEDDHAGAAPTVIVSRGLAERAWPGEAAVGRVLRYFGRDAVVVGVAADVRDESLDSPTSLAFYAPMRQNGAQSGALLLRTDADLAALAPALRERVWSVDPDVPITRLAAFDENVAEVVSGQRYRARLMAVFAALAAAFAMMGVYGVTARAVARRTRELGIRVALGARTEQVGRLVLAQALRLAALGAGLGLLASALTSRYLEGMLYGVAPTDLPSLLGIAALVAATSVLASLPPTRRATRVDPVEALRAE